MYRGFNGWDGSFVEDCEHIRHLPPGDIDVMTFYFPAPALLPVGMAMLPILQNRRATRQHFRVDHVAVPLQQSPVDLVGRGSILGRSFRTPKIR